MNRLMTPVLQYGAVASVLVSFASVAFAQADLSPQQLDEAHRATVGQRTSSPHRPAGFNLQVGETVPGSAPTYKMPDSVDDKAIRRYEYMVIDNRMVLVDPSSRKIIDVVR